MERSTRRRFNAEHTWLILIIVIFYVIELKKNVIMLIHNFVYFVTNFLYSIVYPKA
jgi:hypothetical protein